MTTAPKINPSLPPNYKISKIEKPYIRISKLPAGEHRFRIVQPIISGWIEWRNNKPYRFRDEDKPKKSFNPEEPLQAFWDMYVWDYAKEGLYIMEVTQNGIRIPLENLAHNEDWWDLTSFDFILKKEGGEKIKYSVIPCPHRPISNHIIDAALDSPVRLEALYDGLDPWTDLEASEPELPTLNDEQCAQIDTLLAKVKDPAYQKELEGHLKVTSIYNIHPENDFKRAIRALEQRLESRKNKEASNNGASRVA